jgi:hypothetical protein
MPHRKEFGIVFVALAGFGTGVLLCVASAWRLQAIIKALESKNKALQATNKSLKLVAIRMRQRIAKGGEEVPVPPEVAAGSAHGEDSDTDDDEYARNVFSPVMVDET